jgi:lysophospholipid acyltransferase (LPLAT)-like uncharacterized protein
VKDTLLLKIGHFLLFLLMRGLHFSWRYELLGEEHREQAMKDSAKNNYILSLWHEFMFPCLISEAKRPALLIASKAGGGRAIGAVMEYFGLNVTYGSKNRDGRDKGGKEARDALLNALSNGESAILTIDGSVGPRRFCKAGPVDLARKSLSPVLPFASVASSYWEFRTWDKLKLPKPFAKIVLCYEKPLNVSADVSKEDFYSTQVEIGKRINQAEAKARDHMKSKHNIEVQLPDLEQLSQAHPKLQP